VRRDVLWFVPVVAALPLIAGAGCSASALAPIDPGVDRASFVSRLTAVFCEAIEPCCARFGRETTDGACQQEVAIPFGWAFPGIESARARFDPQMAAACLQATAAYVGRCAGPAFWGQRWGREMDPSLAVCESVLQPMSQLGDLCGSWQDCVTSSEPVTCDWENPASPTVTVCKLIPPPPDIPPETYARIGEPCQSSSTLESCYDPCEPHSYCDNGTCAPERAAGPCGDLCNRACAASSYCDGTQNLCVTRPALPDGASCTSVYQCGNPHPACDQVCGPALLYGCQV
jgi:hypothetical protein